MIEYIVSPEDYISALEVDGGMWESSGLTEDGYILSGSTDSYLAYLLATLS